MRPEIMLRSSLIIFITGWLAWFWIDKPPLGQLGLPEASDSIAENFQRSFNMLKAGHLDMAYVYIWDAHYLLLSLLGGMLLWLVFGSAANYLGRRRMRRNFRPPDRAREKPDENQPPPERSDAPAD
jgi:hypothetical protein